MNRTAVEEIKARLPIEEVLATYIKLDKAGKSYKAKCPFHNEKSPSFFVSPDRGGYYCFGCGAKGDIFSFVEQFEGLDFRGALKILAERAGVPLVYDQKADGERDRMYAAMEEAAKFFEAQFAKTGDAASAEARAYVSGRGITDATRALFRIGFAPEGWNKAHDHLKSKGYSDALIEKIGIIKASDKSEGQGAGHSRFYDRFRGRIMFPITDSSGRVIAFSGRILPRLDDGKAAKYLNSPDTPLYDKSAVLYGLDKAKSHIRQHNYTILVEGQMDLVMSHQAGIQNTVASSGTALGDAESSKDGVTTNLGLIKRLSPNVVIAFDSDAAGRKAALRAAGIALAIGMDVKVVDIQGGKDPADIVKENPEAWKDLLRAKKQIIEFELDNVKREVTDRRELSKALQTRVYPLILSLPSRTDREYFVRLVADNGHIVNQEAIWEDLRILAAKLEKEAAPRAGQPVSGSAKSTATFGASSKLDRIDLVERRMFGLLGMMEKDETAAQASISATSPTAAPNAAPTTTAYRDRIRAIAGASYEERIARIQPLMNDVLFEAEAFFGADTKNWPTHMAELIDNFESDIVSQDLIAVMQDLRTAEKAGDQAKVAELAAKCQILSTKKATLRKREG